MDRNDITKLISAELERLGIMKHLLGYVYLRKAILYLVEDYSLVCRITKSIYPAVAEDFDTEPARVERAIRHAVTNSRYVMSEFKPTNGEVMANIADKIRLEIGIALTGGRLE